MYIPQLHEEDGKRPSAHVIKAMAFVHSLDVWALRSSYVDVHRELNIHAMRIGPGKHLKGLTLMGGVVSPEEVRGFSWTCIQFLTPVILLVWLLSWGESSSRLSCQDFNFQFSLSAYRRYLAAASVDMAMVTPSILDLIIRCWLGDWHRSTKRSCHRVTPHHELWIAGTQIEDHSWSAFWQKVYLPSDIWGVFGKRCCRPADSCNKEFRREVLDHQWHEEVDNQWDVSDVIVESSCSYYWRDLDRSFAD